MQMTGDGCGMNANKEAYQSPIPNLRIACSYKSEHLWDTLI